MKKSYFQFAILIIGLMLTFTTLKASDNPYFTTSDSLNCVIEECTGTWCGYCPCGHDILASLLTMYPRTVALCYHGPPNYGSPADPWAAVGYPMIQLFGMSSYPSAVINRKSDILYRNSWYSYLSSAVLLTPNVRIELSNPTINMGSRTITGTITATALDNLTGTYKIFVAVTENNLVYPQNVYSACGTAGINNSYVHDHVVRAIVTPNAGTLLTSSPWNVNTTQTYNINYVVPAGLDLANCDVNYVVFRDGSPYTTNAPIQNGLTTPTSMYIPTGVGNPETAVKSYELGQNYPNPFNPTTNIRFSVPKDGNVVFKIYDIKGKEVATYLDGFLKAGSYNVTVEGANLSSGVYFYKLMAGSFTETKRMILVK
jgi:hypothetical protein